ncbi:OmpA family protein [Streptomyces armeniacus]|uniref:OmpA family protein n=1 Tax=Streptomyces armeniacus TaxID=83291 RepID=A0A345XYG0_9ACTN|nr:OmpA family protein [Streptomyces armeniacus]AXK36676.1 OmpA family protein [Streptomyces armeniacus]
MNPSHARALRLAACTTSSAVLLTGLASATVHAEPSPPAGVEAPKPTLPGDDNPTTIPTGGPSLPGETGGPAPEYSEPPDNIGDAQPVSKIDAQASGLKLADGAQLAPSKVLDIKFVTEDIGGEERREDSNNKTKFTLQAEVLFPKDSDKLNGEAQSRIEQIAAEVKNQNATEVNVFGFTDDLGSYEHGKTLSKKRATAVQKQLSKELDPNVTFRVRGYSEDYPIADNGTEEGRTKNRRVEVSFPRGE